MSAGLAVGLSLGLAGGIVAGVVLAEIGYQLSRRHQIASQHPEERAILRARATLGG